MILFRDVLRSIRKNIIMDFLLLIQFASCFFASSYLISYYFDIQETEQVYQEQLGKRLYSVFPETEKILKGDSDTLEEVKQCIWDLRNEVEFQYMVIGQDSFYLDTDCMEDIPKKEWKKLQENPEEAEYEDVENDVCWTPGMKNRMVDEAGYQYLLSKITAGRGFTENDFGADRRERLIPVIMGADYAKYFQVGDKIKTMWSGTEVWNCEIIGFLDDTSSVTLSGQTYLNSYILYPAQDRNYKLTEECSVFNELYYCMKCLSGWIVTGQDLPQHRVSGIINEIISRYDIGDLLGRPQTFGTEAFRGEMRETVVMITALVILWLVFLVFTVLMVLVHKIDVRQREYSILLMNGVSVHYMVREYLLELAVFLLGAVAVACFWQPVLRENLGQMNFALYYIGIFVMVIAAILLTAGIMLYIRLQNMDIEQIMRNKE